MYVHTHLGKMIFNIPAIIASLSEGMTLLPGDVILTGTYRMRDIILIIMLLYTLTLRILCIVYYSTLVYSTLIYTFLNYYYEFLSINRYPYLSIGTPDGVGYARKPPRTLLPGDRVRIEIEGLGALENTVALTAADIGTSADLIV